MSHDDGDQKSASRSDDRHTGAEQGSRLISIAFVTALVFGPIVIVTGLLTSRPLPSDALPGISLDALRRSLDSDPSILSLTDDGLRGSKLR